MTGPAILISELASDNFRAGAMGRRKRSLTEPLLNDRSSSSRFAGSVLAKQRLRSMDYGDLKRLSAALKEEAARRGIAGYKVGVLNWPGQTL